ncbi:TetR/AcrR family transcriptional regulator [Kocuria sp. M1R5S2]|uniref:TetR/AcrR family transcriptional regulator n=1 Tax=Kocuria rhizosphaerae TaxID=3376285 RepID=UPI0037B2FBA2
MHPTAPSSLRARKKAETWAAIHEAAAALVVERGTDGTTVEAVAEAAGVSPRTFFNYFRTKEDAILGMRAPALDPALLEDFSPEHDLLGQVSRLLLAVARSAYAGGDASRRRELLREYPQLALRRRELTTEAEELVRRALVDLLAADPRWADGLGEHDVDEAARMLVLLAGVPLHFAISSAHHSPAAGLTPEEHESALDLFHRLERRLA